LIEADTVLTMKVTTQLESRDVIPQTEPHRFTGEAGFRVLHTMDVGAGMPAVTDAGGSAGASTFNAHPGNVSMVRFEAGARTHWHSHSGGQLLFVVEGEGWLQSRGDEVRSIRAGDAVSLAPGEVHWHGAKKDAGIAQLMVTVGKPTWFEESPTPPE
jgi:quercetin dioxygenase-like cupin family protein